jgi:hypothetical protein
MPRRSGCYRYPTRPTLRIEVADPQHALVLYGSPADMGAEDSWERSIWQFVVPRRLDGGSQLLLRHRYAYGPDWTSRLVFGRFPLAHLAFPASRIEGGDCVPGAAELVGPPQEGVPASSPGVVVGRDGAQDVVGPRVPRVRRDAGGDLVRRDDLRSVPDPSFR